MFVSLHSRGGNPDDYLFDMKDLIKPLILISVSSKSVEKCGRLNICKWIVLEAAISYA